MLVLFQVQQFIILSFNLSLAIDDMRFDLNLTNNDDMSFDSSLVNDDDISC